MSVSGSKVKGQKNIDAKSNVSLSSSRPIRFQGAGSSANLVSRCWEFNQSGDFGVPLLSNQVSRHREFDQSGFKELGIQPIRFRGAENSTNQVISVSRSHSTRFRGVESSTNQVSRSWEFNQSGVFGVPLSSNQVSRCREFDQSDFKELGIRPIR